MGIDTDHEPRHPNIKYVIAPERPVGSMSAPSPELGRTPEKRSRKGLIIGLSSGIAGAAIAAGAIMGLNAASEAPSTQPTAEAPADPSAPLSPETDKNEPLPSELELEIPAGLSAEEVGALIIDRYDAWNNAGGNNQQIIDGWHDRPESMSTGDYVAARAQEYSSYFAGALYVEGWDTPGLYPDLVKNFEVHVGMNTYTLEQNLKTSDPDSHGDEAPYRLSNALDGAREVSKDGDTRVIAIDFTESSNASQNRVGEELGGDNAVQVPRWTYVVTLVTVDGTERIAAIDLASRQS